MRSFCAAILVSGTVLGIGASATTLQQLSTGDMIQKSTAIVRGKVTGSNTAFVGKDIYTYYQLQVTQTLKSAPAQQMTQQIQVAVPGGAARGLRQMVAGAPALANGQDYVIFLWTSRSGLTQIIGLSQGLFTVIEDSNGNPVLVRPAAAAMMLSQSGQPVASQPVSMSLSALQGEIQTVLGASK
jgi:hypothetical protein